MARPDGQGKKQQKQKKPVKRQPVQSIPHASGLGHFGRSLRDMGPSQMYSGGGTGSVTTKHELGLQVVDFFDYQSASPSGVAQFVNNYYWNTNQNLFATNPTVPGGEDLTFCRVRRVDVWVLPQARGISDTFGQIQTNAEQMYTVNCQVPGVTTNRESATGDPEAFALNTQVTNCLPAFDPRWKKVLSCDLQKTFKSAVVRPVFANISSPTDPSLNPNQCLFQISIVNPLNGQPYQSGNADEPDPGIRVKVQLQIDQPIQTVGGAKFGVFRNEEFGLPYTGQNEPDFTGTTLQYAQIDLKRSQDFLS